MLEKVLIKIVLFDLCICAQKKRRKNKRRNCSVYRKRYEIILLLYTHVVMQCLFVALTVCLSSNRKRNDCTLCRRNGELNNAYGTQEMSWVAAFSSSFFLLQI